MATSGLDRQVEHRLRERQVRYTRGRRAVISALAAADGPRSAADLHGEIRADVPLSSLYRSLTVLEEAGVLAPHYSIKGITRYELAEWLAGHHHHLVCLNCGSVEDIEISDRLEASLRDIVAGIGAEISFDPSNHALEIEGRCARCR
ncbi:MAG TPA: Fur family transcriptional regulator [Acidimicrobiia bacterium]|nr:Fur family transcriptional regulator [Acidimicrobiia bacterium]